MRVILDSLVAVMLAALLAGLVIHQNRQERDRREITELRSNIRIIEQQISLQTALAHAPRNEYGFPTTIDPEWFDGPVPRNPLLENDHPWLEIAAADELELDHPIHRVATESIMAGFWYNPRKGIVRARMPRMVSDRKTLETYNFVNGSRLESLFAAVGSRDIPSSLVAIQRPSADDDVPALGLLSRWLPGNSGPFLALAGTSADGR